MRKLLGTALIKPGKLPLRKNLSPGKKFDVNGQGKINKFSGYPLTNYLKRENRWPNGCKKRPEGPNAPQTPGGRLNHWPHLDNRA